MFKIKKEHSLKEKHKIKYSPFKEIIKLCTLIHNYASSYPYLLAMQFLTYLIFRFFTFFISLLPFKLIYLFADGLTGLLYHVVKYRKKVIQENLRNSFPEKTTKEINHLTKEFYRHFADIVLESFKGTSLSKEELIKRYTLVNPEVTNQFYAAGKNVLALGGHFSNWEWTGLSIPFQADHTILVLYKPLNNKYIDKEVKKTREQNGTVIKSMYETSQHLGKLTDNLYVYCMLADQCPNLSHMPNAYWFDFLQQDTPFLYGPEKYSHQLNYPVIFYHVERVKRGHYKAYSTLLSENPAELPDGEITRRYKTALEKVIQKQPQNWLWSHKRWKRKRKN